MRNVSKSFGETSVLDSISLKIRQGQFVTLLGPSGCGKTTSLRILAGFEQPGSGDVAINGRSVANLPPWRRDIGIVFQTYALFPYLTASDNIAFGLKMRRVAKPEIRARVAAALEMVGLAGYGARYPRQMSGGQRQRVALARALVKPQLLLLDEPLSNLDAKLRNEMRYELKRIQRESGVTTVFVTHDQEEAFSLSDHIVLMSKGVIKQAGAPRELWERPNSAFVADFIGVENLWPATVCSSGDAAFIQLSETVLLPHARPRSANGSRVVAGLRASDIKLQSASSPASSADFPARIVDMEYRGETVAYRLVSDRIAHPIRVLAPSSERYDTEVVVSLAENRLMVMEDDR
jgi:ABC-type Fe3+/spermidine/putrescine transport system ATPase subunit